MESDGKVIYIVNLLQMTNEELEEMKKWGEENSYLKSENRKLKASATLYREDNKKLQEENKKLKAENEDLEERLIAISELYMNLLKYK